MPSRNKSAAGGGAVIFIFGIWATGLWISWTLEDNVGSISVDIKSDIITNDTTSIVDVMYIKYLVDIEYRSTCFWVDKPFEQADYYIPGVIEEQAHRTLYSNDATLWEEHNLETYKRKSIWAGIFWPVVGVMSLLNFPNDSTCMNMMHEYKNVSWALAIAWGLAMLGIFILVIACFGCWWKSRKERRGGYYVRHNDTGEGVVNSQV